MSVPDLAPSLVHFEALASETACAFHFLFVSGRLSVGRTGSAAVATPAALLQASQHLLFIQRGQPALQHAWLVLL